MSSFLPIIHALGTKPLTVSMAAQLIVIALAVRSKDRERLTQSVILMAGLLLAVTSIALRPPSPALPLPDVLGSLAALFFFAPAVEALLKRRQAKKGKN